MDELLQRVDRLESIDAIRQLVSFYGMCIDHRDMDTLTRLFVDDVRVTRTERGHEALRALLDSQMYQFTTSIHFVGNHVIDFVDSDHAEGKVYSKVEHEYGDQWVMMGIEYWDRYERRDGRWLFTGRQVKSFYACDILERPNGADKVRWTVSGPAEIPQTYATWHQFWAEGAAR
ncbi:MAG: hypothetical protein RLZZ623_447 [Actinomycetota bacterium]